MNAIERTITTMGSLIGKIERKLSVVFRSSTGTNETDQITPYRTSSECTQCTWWRRQYGLNSLCCLTLIFITQPPTHVHTHELQNDWKIQLTMEHRWITFAYFSVVVFISRFSACVRFTFDVPIWIFCSMLKFSFVYTVFFSTIFLADSFFFVNSVFVCVFCGIVQGKKTSKKLVC